MTFASRIAFARGRLRPIGVMIALVWAVLAGGPPPAAAQAPLQMVNEETTVSQISFKFVGNQTLDPNRLQQQIATQAPSFFDRLRDVFDWLPFVEPPMEYLFDPVTLQRDVVRLRRFYQENGFLNPRVDYPASQFDTTSNSIHVIFSIEEGPPVIIQSTDFYGPDSTQYAAAQFEDALRDEWVAFRDDTGFRLGERYTRFNRLQVGDEVRQWLQNHGFAFARVNSQTRIDSTNYTADIRFFIDAGPRGRISEINVEGNTSVSSRIVMRELPFRVGDYFSYDRILNGQRQLFGLNLFRVALADVPPQPRDSTVAVRYRVREASLRYLTAQTGYGTTTGLVSEGQWTHRNFFGAARNFSIGLIAETGFLSNPGLITSAAQPTIPNRRFRGSVSLRQPYLFSPRLSATLEPFITYRRSALLEPSEEFLGINARDFGLNTTLIYEPLPFRTISLRHAFTRAYQFTQMLSNAPGPDDPIDPINSDDPADPIIGGDLYNRSVLSLNAILGRADDFLNPTQGFQLRPSVEVAGALLGSSVQYARLSNELTGYRPFGENIEVAGRLFLGRLWPRGESKERLDAGDPVYENRFDDIRFYTGGSNDVRGWRNQLAGDKFARTRETCRQEDTEIVCEVDDPIFEPIGGNTKLAANLELRLPFPGLGSAWRTAVFLDAGQVRERSFAPTQLRFGTGTGIRYRTPVGYLRLDLAYKLNPGPLDLRDPGEVLNDKAEPRFINRFRLHIGIGQSF